jgi:hypothetical protein
VQRRVDATGSAPDACRHGKRRLEAITKLHKR